MAEGRRSSRARRPTQRLGTGSEPGPSTRHSRFPSRLRATVHRCPALSRQIWAKSVMSVLACFRISPPLTERGLMPGAVCRYSPEGSESEEDPDLRLLQRSTAHETRSIHPRGASSGPGRERNANGAVPRVLLRWSGRPESLDSQQPPVQAMLRSQPRDRRQPGSGRQPDSADEGAGGAVAAGSCELRPRREAAGMSPDHGLRKSQRSTRSTASPSPVPEGLMRHPADADGSTAAFTRMPSQGAPPVSAPESARTNGFPLSPGRTTRRRLRHPDPAAANFPSPSVMETDHTKAMVGDEQEQLEEAIRQSLLSSEESQRAEGLGSRGALDHPAQRGRSGLRIKLRGAS